MAHISYYVAMMFLYRSSHKGGLVQYVNHGYQHPQQPQQQVTLVPYQPSVVSAPNVQYVTQAPAAPYLLPPAPQPAQNVVYLTTPAAPGQNIQQGFVVAPQVAPALPPQEAGKAGVGEMKNVFLNALYCINLTLV